MVIKEGTAVNFYLDGTLLTNAASGSHTNAVAATNPLSIGAATSSGSIYYQAFIGDVANLQIYNRVLSQAEIKQNYNAQRSRFT